MESKSFDIILTQLGTGKWNGLYYLTIWYWYSLVSYHTLGGAFLAPPVPFTCRPPADANASTVIILPEGVPTASTNITYSYEEISIPTQDSCSYLARDPVTGLLQNEPCTEWDFDNSTFESTVTSEFQLVCGKKYLQATYQSIYMFGILVGAGCNGFLADRFGRWTLIMIASSFYTIIAVGSSWLPNIPTILTARFLLGCMHPASLQTGFILVMEVTELQMRSKIGIFQFFSWSVGTMLWGGFAYAVRDWRWLQLMVSLPCFLFHPGLWLLDESPRWLIIRGQHDRALRVLRKAASWNKATLAPEDQLRKIMEDVQYRGVKSEDDSAVDTKLSKVHHWYIQATLLFRTPRLRIITLSMCMSYFVVAMVFFGLGLGASTLNVNPYLFMTISGLVELPSTTVIIPIVAYIGRKKTIIFNFIICGVALLIQPLIPQDYNWLTITLVMIGKLCSASAFGILFLYASELYPTEIRTRGMSAAMMSSRVGAIISPFLMSALSSTYPWAIPVVFGSAALLASLSQLPLSETLNVDLPDTIKDLEEKQSVISKNTDTKPDAATTSI